jgi:hypothetical protein
MHNLNYAPTTLGVQSRREIISGGTRTITITEKLQKYIDLREELTRERQLNAVYITTISIINNGYYPPKITRQFAISQSSPCSIYSNADSSNTQYMPTVRKVLAEQ